MKQEKVKTSISINKDLHEFIRSLGENENRSFSQQLSKMLQDFKQKYDQLKQD